MQRDSILRKSLVQDGPEKGRAMQLGRSDAAYPPSVQVELECGAQTSTLQFNDKGPNLRR
jgi:hypothetical protein